MRLVIVDRSEGRPNCTAKTEKGKKEKGRGRSEFPFREIALSFWREKAGQKSRGEEGGRPKAGESNGARLNMAQ
jgi:hypothetical protein